MKPRPFERSSCTAPASRRRGRVLCAVALAAATWVGATSPADAAAVPPAPTVPAGLPTQIENLATYVPADSCDPTAKPGVVRFGDLLRSTYPGTSYAITRTCGTDPLPTSEHYDGRAVDWFTSVRDVTGKARAQEVIRWLFAKDAAGNAYANARRLGIMYIIWDNKIWGAYRASDGWRPYSSCARHPGAAWDTTCHRNHMHFSLSWEGAEGRTSFWTKTVAAVDFGPCRAADLNWAAPYTKARSTPCPSYPVVTAPARAAAVAKTLTTYSGMVLHTGSAGPAVAAVQDVLGVASTARFTAATAAAVSHYQTQHRLAGTGWVNANTWRALLGHTATSSPGGATHPAPAPKHTSPLTRYEHKVLRRGSHGLAVKALQRRLHVHPSGRFRASTVRRVKRFQHSHHLPATGVVRLRTWRALGA